MTLAGTVLRCLLVAVLVAVSGTALAQNDAAAAEYLFRQGREAMERGDTAVACEKFAASYELDPAAGTLINLAACFEERHLTASAWEAWQRALARLGPDDDRTPAVRERLAAAETRLARLTIELAPGAPPGTVVEKDGVTLGAAALGTGLPADPGEHVIVTRAPGRVPRRVTVLLEDGAATALVVSPGAPLPRSRTDQAPTPPPAKPANEHPGRGVRRAGTVLGGLGVAGLITGGVTGSLAFSAKRTMDDECRTAEAELYCTPTGLDAGDRGATFAPVSSVAFAVGGAALVGGAVLMLVGHHREAVAVRAGASSAGAQLTLRLAF